MRSSIIAVMILLAGCAPSSGIVPRSTSNYEFRLGVGDVVRVDVYREERLSREYPVSSDGAISFPLLGSLPISGLTVPEFKTLLMRELNAKVLKDPQVTVDVVKYRSVFILGEVARPGEYPYSPDLSFMALIAKAGGLTFRANEKTVMIRHDKERTETRYQLTPDAAIQPGDTVRVTRSTF